MTEIALGKIKELLAMMPGSVIAYQVKNGKLKRLCNSPQVPAIYGYTEEEYERVFGSDPLKVVHPMDHEEINTVVCKCLMDHKDIDVTFRVYSHSGNINWVHAMAHYLGTYEGEPVLLGALIDVSKETQARDKVLDNTIRAIYVCDKETREILYANKVFYETLSREGNKLCPENVIGHKCYDVVCHAQDKERACCAGIQAAESGTPIILETNSSPGTYYKIEGKSILWGEKEAYVIYFRDVTEEQQVFLAYVNHMEGLLHLNAKALSTYQVNIEQNTCFDASAKIPELKEISVSGTFSGAVEAACQYIPDKKYSRIFKKVFSKDNLLRCYQKGKTRVSMEHPYVLPNGETRRLETTMELKRNPKTKCLEGVTCSTDITVEYLKSRITAMLFQKEYDCVIVVDTLDCTYTVMTMAFGDLDGVIDQKKSYNFDEAQPWEKYIMPEDYPFFKEHANLETVREELKHSTCYTYSMYGLSFKNRNRVRRRKFSHYYLDEAKRYILVTIEDVTSLMNRDPLTGQYNRQGFLEFTRGVLLASKPEEEFAILFFDIQGFKAINDIFGIEGGDRILKRTTELIKASALDPIAIARFDADHFVVLINKDNLDFEAITELCARGYTAPDGKRFNFYAKCGIYNIRKKTKNVSSMCDKASMAKDFILDEYATPYAVYDKSMKDAFMMKKELTSDLVQAMENREFEVYYQPVYDARTEKIASAEALVRWIHPTRGVVSPGYFIPAFEENGYISELDLFVARTTKNFLERRFSQKQHIVPVAVNFSRMDFYDTNMMETVMEEFSKARIPKEMQRLEITESAYSTLADQRNARLSSFKEMGIKILVDDFGCGYSSFSTIQEFDFDILKVDMGFVRKIGQDVKTERIICAIIHMAHDLGMQVVAEGAETKEQVDFLKNAGCDYIQGYYYSRPISEAAFEELLGRESNNL